MATMRERCRWCGLLLEVPVQAQSIMCPGCHTLIQLQNRNAIPHYGAFFPAMDGGHGYTTYAKPPGNNFHRIEPYHVPAPPPRVQVHNNRRRAVLCGVTYRGHKKSLKGSVNNVRWIRNLLVENLGFPTSSILILTVEPSLIRSRNGSAKWEDHRNPYSIYKGTSGGTAICISACDDHQNSADTTAFTGTTIGSLTFSFIETLKKEPKLTYGRLLMSLRNLIDEAQRGIFQDGRAAMQVPQLSSSERFDIHSKIMNL